MPAADLVFNGRFLTHEVTGVERYAGEIARRLIDRVPGMIVAAPPGTPRPEWVPPESWVTPGHSRGHLWEQVDLPLYLARHGRPLLVGLSNSGPISYRRQVASHLDVGYLRWPDSYSWAYRTWYRVMAWLLVRTVRLVVTLSEFSRGELVACLGVQPAKVRIVSPGVGPEFVRGDSPREAFALAVGSPSAHKNTARLVQAWTRVYAATGIELRVVGAPLIVSGGPRLTLDAPGVVAHGRVSDVELIELYQRARLSLVPSVYEGFGLPVIESQACGCPVAASEAASLPEVLAGSGALFDPHDPDSIARSAIRVLTDDSYAATLVAAGLRNAERFSWETAADQVAEIVAEASRPEKNLRRGAARRR